MHTVSTRTRKNEKEKTGTRLCRKALPWLRQLVCQHLSESNSTILFWGVKIISVFLSCLTLLDSSTHLKQDLISQISIAKKYFVWWRNSCLCFFLFICLFGLVLFSCWGLPNDFRLEKLTPQVLLQSLKKNGTLWLKTRSQLQYNYSWEKPVESSE